jgi:hypothetical protein
VRGAYDDKKRWKNVMASAESAVVFLFEALSLSFAGPEGVEVSFLLEGTVARISSRRYFQR